MYSNYRQVIKDVNYGEQFEKSRQDRYHNYYEEDEYVEGYVTHKLKKIWLERLQEKFDETKKANNALGKFLRAYPMKFKEFCCLLDLIEETNEKTDYELENGIKLGKDVFKKHRVRFESSRLKKYKLVFRIVNPLRPMKTVYEVSYRAQLGLKNLFYSDQYQQLDLALEEESKRNSPDELESLYYIIKPQFDFTDLIADEKLFEQLNTALSRDMKKDQIFKKWGFNKVIDYGRGTTLNFRGPPGTGKTLAANCLAKQLSKQLLMVRYDQIQSAWIGETEKHIQQVFRMATVKNAVLFFDEADALALDRANLGRSWEMSQVNTLLKELERFEGVCIFATNFAEKYDPAFQRRLTMHIDFRLPDKEQCEKILEKMLPKRAREKNLSLTDLNIQKLSGGEIKNIALNAAGYAAKDNAKKIQRTHLEKAVSAVRSAKEKKSLGYIA